MGTGYIGKNSDSRSINILETVARFVRKCIFQIISVGPVPDHIAFIMDGNRRYAKRRNLAEGVGHRAGYLALLSMLHYCYELGVRCVTVYAFSIDNFKRSPEEVNSLMDLMLEKIEALIKEESIVNHYGIRVYFIGNLKLLSEPVRLAAERAMAATANNKKGVFSICVAYTSTNEIMNAVQESCEEKRNETNLLNGNVADENGELEQAITARDIERHMYMAITPDPDILIRTSGENRLSNFLLWQTSHCYLYSPSVLWPDIGLRHLLWAVLNFQRNHTYLVKRKKQL